MPFSGSVGNSPVPTTPSYCTVAQVYQVLQKPVPSEHGDEGDPTAASVTDKILMMEEEIDHTCGTSWRQRRELLEYHNWDTFFDEESWILVALKNKPVLQLDASQGDALEVRQGGFWVDYLGQFTQGPNGQFWIEEPSGYLRIRRGPFEFTDQARVRISYRYGSLNVPPDIKNACAMLVAAELSSGDLVATGGMGANTDRLALDPRIRRWERRAYSILASYQKWGGS